MVTDLQKATMWKRMAAWLLDMILLAVLAVGAASAISALMKYDGMAQDLQAVYTDYEAAYDVESLQINQAEYDALDETERAKFESAINAMNEDDYAVGLKAKIINTTILIATFGLLVGVMVMEFVIPLILKNGQTLGKKCFGIGLIREDGVQISVMQLFVRSLLGKYTVCSMLPAYLIILLLNGAMGLAGLIVLLGLLITHFCLMAFSRNNGGIPDMMAATVQVDLASQKVFKTTEDLLEYTKRIHAERAQRQDY